MPSGLARLFEGRALHLLAFTVGALTFFAWIGYGRTLDPRDLGWIFHEDPFTHVMGWEQYRNAPLLQYPITKNELYGLEWSSTVVFTDSIPIVAVLLKPLSSLLPTPFQYLGWWVLLSLVLQAYWGAKLMLLRSARLRDAAVASVFFVISPVVLERFGLQTAVGSHWLLLWALWLYFSGRAATRTWAIVLLLTVSVHAYLFAMVGAIWVAHLASRRLRRQLAKRDLAYAGATLVLVLVWMHVLGYFAIGGGAAGSGWRSNFDLLGFVAPATGARISLMTSVYDDPWDGSSYLGAGMLLLLVASAVAYFVRRRRATENATSSIHVPWTPLVTAVVAMGMFAITNHITMANQTVAMLPLPGIFEPLYDTFRGANRMIWPAYYLVMVATLWLAVRAWPSRMLGAVLAGTMLLQAVDLSGIGAIKRGEVQGHGMTRDLHDPIWPMIARHYRRIVSVPATHRQLHWPTFAWFAARNGLGSNIGYVSRNNAHVRAEGARAHLQAVASGTYDSATVYYFPSPVLWTVARQTMGPKDVGLIADGFHLLLPGGRAWTQQLAPPPGDDVPMLGEEISFGAEESDGLLIDGWSWREGAGTWSIGNQSWLVLPVVPNERVRVTFDWGALPSLDQPQALRIHLDDEVYETRFLPSQASRRDMFEVTTRSRLLSVRIEIAEHIKIPNQRAIGLFLVAARVQRAADPIAPDIPDAARGTPILDTWISFAHEAPGRAYLHRGWSFGEGWGTWSSGPEASLALPVPANERVQISLRWLSTAPLGSFQQAQVFIDDQPYEVIFPKVGQDQESSFEITTQRNWISIRIVVARPVNTLGHRVLGVGVKEVRIRRVVD